MEFALEMVIKASLERIPIAEVPITLHRDGRTTHPPHLRTFRDGWRSLRFFLLFSPRWLFLIPGVTLVLAGLLGYAMALPPAGFWLNGVHFDVHTLLVASLALLLGHQAILFAVMTKVFGINARLLPADARIARLSRILTLERSLALGLAAAILGLELLLIAVAQWRATGFGSLDFEHSMRWVIPGTTLMALGAQTVFSSFFISVVSLPRRYSSN